MKGAIGSGLMFAGLISAAVFCDLLPALGMAFIGILILLDGYIEETRE